MVIECLILVYGWCFSYSWGVEEETKIIDALEAQCLEQNIQLIHNLNETRRLDQLTDCKFLLNPSQETFEGWTAKFQPAKLPS